jgi:hypothetical protein
LPPLAYGQLTLPLAQAMNAAIPIVSSRPVTLVGWTQLCATLTNVEFQLLPQVALIRPQQGFQHQEEELLRALVGYAVWWYSEEWPQPDRVARLLAYVTIAM